MSSSEETMHVFMQMLRGSFSDDETEAKKETRDWTTGDFVYLVKKPGYWWFVQDDGSDPQNTTGNVYLISEDSQTNIYFPEHCRKWTGPEPIVTPWLQGVIDEYRSNTADQRHVTRCVDSDGPVSEHACCKQKE
jgi:hypothetical protein